MAANAVNCAIRLLEIQRITPPPKEGDPTRDLDNGKVRGIAFAISIAACLVHTLSRRGGLLVNNFFAAVKIAILLLILIITIVYFAKPGLKPQPEFGNKYDTLHDNLLGSNSFRRTQSIKARPDALNYATAFLSVIFTCSGYEQANYVLGEIEMPHRKFPIAAYCAVALVSFLYIIVNVCYVSDSVTNCLNSTNSPL